MEYSSEVRRRFSAPASVGDLLAEAGDVVEGAAEDVSLRVWIRFQVQLQGTSISRVRFRAYGCPHTLAAADRIAEDLEGRTVDSLTRVDLQEVARSLGIPREKYGKLLRLEDALGICHAQARDAKRPAAANEDDH